MFEDGDDVGHSRSARQAGGQRELYPRVVCEARSSFVRLLRLRLRVENFGKLGLDAGDKASLLACGNDG